jgi:hypothetical protein
MGASRQAYDLWHPACRAAFRSVLSRAGRDSQWRRWYFWRLVIADTWQRVCSRPTPREEA